MNRVNSKNDINEVQNTNQNKMNNEELGNDEKLNFEEGEEEEEEREEEEEEEEENIEFGDNKIKKEEIILKKKCSLKEHEELDAVSYCQECKIYMCNKCEKIHFELFKNHHLYNLDKDVKNIFTGFCKQKKHQSFELEYFCQNHNTLCCAACITKIKGKGNGKHNNCEICFIKKIKNKKKNNLNYIIKYLEKLSNTLEQSLNKLKKLFEEINKNKEKLKVDIRIVFTKIRDCLNEREDELLLKVDKEFDNFFFKEELIKESDKLPIKVKSFLEKSKLLIKDNWNDGKKLKSLINDCIIIENNIDYIRIINEKVKKSNFIKDLEVTFTSEKK